MSKILCWTKNSFSILILDLLFISVFSHHFRAFNVFLDSENDMHKSKKE